MSAPDQQAVAGVLDADECEAFREQLRAREFQVRFQGWMMGAARLNPVVAREFRNFLALEARDERRRAARAEMEGGAR